MRRGGEGGGRGGGRARGQGGGEHIRREAGGCKVDIRGKRRDEYGGRPEEGELIDRMHLLEEAVSLRMAGFAMEDSVLKGLGVQAAPRAEGGQISVEPGGVGGKVAFASSHLMYAAGQELGETHKCVRGEGGVERVARGGGSEGAPLS